MAQKEVQLKRKIGDKTEDVLVRVCYCAATEIGYERISGNSIEVFSPKHEKDENGNMVVKPASATLEDYIQLALSAIISAYISKGEEAPVKSEDLMYACTSKQITNLIREVVALRNEWYLIPELATQGEEEKKDEKPEKN